MQIKKYDIDDLEKDELSKKSCFFKGSGWFSFSAIGCSPITQIIQMI